MLKVFLVEDEFLIREGLRDNIPWQQYGVEFAGEASDGEMALPMIRKTQPDVLITDIKMPFMDGLALAKIVSREFPKTKIVIISGYDEFDYAHKAIEVGVEKYLLKPITKAVLQDTLVELRDKIEAEQEQNNYQGKFRDELREYEQFSRRRFYEQLFSGELSVQQVYELAEKNKIEINASCYNVILLCLMSEKDDENHERTYSEEFSRVQDEMLRFFLRYPDYQVFRWNMNTFGILIKGEEEMMNGAVERCLSNIERICSVPGSGVKWYVSRGETVNRLSLLPDCYRQANRLLSHRFLVPDRHILTEREVSRYLPGEEKGNLEQIDVSKVDPEILKEFLYHAHESDVAEFVESYLDNLQDALASKLFRNYVMLNFRFTAISFAQAIGYTQEEFTRTQKSPWLSEHTIGMEDLRRYAVEVLTRAIELREKRDNTQDVRMMKKALKFINENYMEVELSLNDVAKYVDISCNYFSAIFSQEMKVTFTEYVTKKRMEKAKELLGTTQKRSGEIALEVGYKDPHYFSFVFKKTQGMTPKEYRHEVRNV